MLEFKMAFDKTESASGNQFWFSSSVGEATTWLVRGFRMEGVGLKVLLKNPDSNCEC